jgi:CRISPR-associated protein Cmr5
MSVHTRSQKLAQAAFPRVQERHSRLKERDFNEYVSFAKKFPALIHTCGLAQAVAFADAKRKKDKPDGGPEGCYLEDLAAVLHRGGQHEIPSAETLRKQTRDVPLSGYVRLTRDAINAAGWLKRYVEAAAPDDVKEGG